MLFLDSGNTTTKESLLVDLIPSADEISLSREPRGRGSVQLAPCESILHLVLEDLHLRLMILL